MQNHLYFWFTKNNPMKFLKSTLLLAVLFLFSTNIQAQVKAFGPTGYNGQGIELKPGKYMYSQLQKRSLHRGTVSSYQQSTDK